MFIFYPFYLYRFILYVFERKSSKSLIKNMTRLIKCILSTKSNNKYKKIHCK